jgi:Uma2 family endonuclease
MNATTQNVTAEMLSRMPEDGFRYELVKGELRKMTPSGSRHAVTIANLTVLLGLHVKDNKLGIVLGAEAGFKIASNPDTVRAPDIAFVRHERVPSSGVPEAFWPGPPDLAVEVLSPTDTVYEIEEKVADWLSAGTQMVWILNPKRRIIHVQRPHAEVQTLTANDILDGQDIVPGLRCNAADIFV